MPGTLQSTEWMSKDGCTSRTSACTPGCSVASSSTCQPVILFRPKFTRRSRWKCRSEKLWKFDAEATSTSRHRPSDRAPSRALPGTGSAFRQQQHSAAFSSAMATLSTGGILKKKKKKKTVQEKKSSHKQNKATLQTRDATSSTAVTWLVFIFNKQRLESFKLDSELLQQREEQGPFCPTKTSR